jgi:serine/threonine-protein kinase ULK/ATG1
MSPEVLQHQPYNTKSDMWSLAMVFYEIVHGYCAWNADSPQDLLKNIFAQDLKFGDHIKFI